MVIRLSKQARVLKLKTRRSSLNRPYQALTRRRRLKASAQQSGVYCTPCYSPYMTKV